MYPIFVSLNVSLKPNIPVSLSADVTCVLQVCDEKKVLVWKSNRSLAVENIILDNKNLSMKTSLWLTPGKTAELHVPFSLESKNLVLEAILTTNPWARLFADSVGTDMSIHSCCKHQTGHLQIPVHKHVMQMHFQHMQNFVPEKSNDMFYISGFNPKTVLRALWFIYTRHLESPPENLWRCASWLRVEGPTCPKDWVELLNFSLHCRVETLTRKVLQFFFSNTKLLESCTEMRDFLNQFPTHPVCKLLRSTEWREQIELY